jgi:uncharacterized protein (TIRG00374 family)
MRRVKRFRWLKVAVGVGLLAFIVSRVDPHELASLLREGDGQKLALGLGLLYLANPVLQALRLHVLVARYTRSLALTFKIFFVSAFFNIMLPSNVGGDAIRLMYLRKLGADGWGGPIVLLMLHRLTGMLVLLLAAGVYAAFSLPHLQSVLHAANVQTHLPLSSLAAGAVCVGAALLAWFALSTRYRERLHGIVQKFAAECREGFVQIGAGNMSVLLLLTAAFHAVRMFAFFVLVGYAGERIAPFDALIVLAATALAGVVPITVGGLGLMEGAISTTLVLFGVTPGAAVAVAIANRLIMLVGAATGGIVYLGSRDAQPVLAAEKADRR